MKKSLSLPLLFIALHATAFYEDPHQEFDMTHNMTNDVKIVFRQVKDANAACNKESQKRGYGGFGYAVEACSFWNRKAIGADECVVVTAKKVNFHTLGHEIRHCIQGSFHQ
jgi:hypothetical protein